MFDGFCMKIKASYKTRQTMRLPTYLKLTVICAQDDTQNLPFFHFGLFQVIFFYKIYLFVVKVIVYFQFCKNKTGYKNIMFIRTRYN